MKNNEFSEHMLKSEFMRDSYDSTAEFYNDRYKIIQFQKYSLTLHEIVKINKIDGIFEVKFPEIMLDYGGGSLLLLNFLRYAKRYIEDKDFILPHNDNAVIHLEYFTKELINKINLCFNITSHPSQIRLYLPLMINCDVSFEMLVQGLHQFRELHITLQNIACDGEHLPFREKVFAGVCSYTVLQNLEDPLKGLDEINRISKDRNFLIVSILRKIDPAIYKSILNKLNDLYVTAKNIELSNANYEKIYEFLENQYNIVVDPFQKESLKTVEDFIWVLKK